MTSVLVIAGSDSSGGAGIVRDVRTLTQLGVDAMCALTAVTAQSDATVMQVFAVPAGIVGAQIDAAFATRAVGAVKIGMLACAATVEAVTIALHRHAPPHVVLDPVLESSSGKPLLDAPGRRALHAGLLGQVTLLTPNIPEAAALLGTTVATDTAGMLAQGRGLLALGPRAVLLKGGHASGNDALDLLVTPESVHELRGPRFAANRRGTGCALATAVAAALAQGRTLVEACASAKEHVSALLRGER